MLADDVKLELSRFSDKGDCCPLWELRGYAETWGTPMERRLFLRAKLRPVARRIYALLRRLGADPVSVTHLRSGGLVVVGNLPENVAATALAAMPGSRCCRRAYLRGCFLARGFLGSGRHGYHWECKTPSETQAKKLKRAMESLGLKGVRTGRWQNGWVAYLKDSEEIAHWLGLVGATESLMAFETARVAKQMRNTVNRRVNYETANLSRVVAAAMRQVEDINLIASTIGLASLPAPLRDLAQARLDDPNASLAELASSLNPPVSKSGASHRLRRIAFWADRIRQDRAKRDVAPPPHFSS